MAKDTGKYRMFPEKTTYDLKEAVEWITFGETGVGSKRIHEEYARFERAKDILRDALLLNKIQIRGHYRGDGVDFPGLSKIEDLSIRSDAQLDLGCNEIYYESDGSRCEYIEISKSDLLEYLPSGKIEKLLSAPKKQKQKRPERTHLYDIAYYFWKKHKNITAEKLRCALEEVCEDYCPDLLENRRHKEGEAISSGGFAKYYTSFRNGAYHPGNTRQALEKLYGNIFQLLDASWTMDRD